MNKPSMWMLPVVVALAAAIAIAIAIERRATMIRRTVRACLSCYSRSRIRKEFENCWLLMLPAVLLLLTMDTD